VQGSNAAETIKVTQDNGRITVAGVGYVDAAKVKSIVVDAKGGDDTVEINVPPQLTAKTSVVGGGGNDKLVYPRGATFTGVSGFEKYAYANPISPTGGSGGGGTGGGSTANQTPGWYFETQSGLVGYPNEKFGPFATKQAAQSALNQRLELFEGNRSAITRDIYYVGGNTGGTGNGSTGGSTGGSNQGTSIPSSIANAISGTMQSVANAYQKVAELRNQLNSFLDRLSSNYQQYSDIFNYVRGIRAQVDTILNDMNSTIMDIYNRYGRQPNIVWSNPSVLGYMAQQLRNGGDRARAEMNRTIPGTIWQPVRSVANSVLDSTVYAAADIMDNLAAAISNARRP
jgi:hypothetical protein